MTTLAAIRPDSVNFPLFLHVLGAMILVGGLTASAGLVGFAHDEARLLRFGYWSLVAVSLPGWILMRVGAEWVYSREGWDDLPSGFDYPTWLDLGRIVADAGGVVLLVSLIVGAFGLRRLGQGKGSRLLRVTLILSVLLLVAYLVAVWAMAGKPS
jgi:hypothetical protein